MKEILYGVRSILVENGKVLCIKNKLERIGYYDLPGGQIEKGETPYQTCVREFKEETGMSINKATYKGTLIITTSKKIYNLKIFLVNDYSGNPIEELIENYCMWMDLKEYLSKEKLYANAIILDDFFYKVLNRK